jgi:lipoprotein signal peptidase
MSIMIMGIPSSGWWPHLLAPATFLLFFTLPPYPLRALELWTLATVFFYQCLVLPPNSDTGQTSSLLRYSLVTMWLYYVGWLAKMLLRNPEHAFWRTGRAPHEAEKLGFGWEKFKWALSLLSSPRGVGWNTQLPDLQLRRRLLGRWRFALRQALLAAVMYIVVDGCSTFLKRQHFHIKEQRVSDLPLYWSVVLEIAIALSIWAGTELQFAVWSFCLVVLGLSEEKDIFPLFGDITAVGSLEEFWGEFWHQNLRIMFLDYGRSVCRFLHIRRSKDASWIVQVWTAFLISGAMNAAACWSLSPLPPFDGFYERFASPFIFFILQAVGLTIEGLFLETPVRDITLYEVGLEDERILGRIWTLGWLLFSGHWVLECWLKTEMGLLSVPFSIVGPALDRLQIGI